MLLNSILICLTLILGILIASSILWILLNRNIKFWQAIKFVCIANALNKFLLTGSGYMAMSGKLKISGVPLYKSLSSFGVLELFSTAPLLLLGLYFGARIIIRIPLFLIVFFVLGFAFAIYRRKKVIGFLKKILSYFTEIKFNILMVIPVVLINIVIKVIYYFFLFRVFGFSFNLLDILKITSVAFTIGYLSPVPAGLGFKDGGLVFLLMQQSLSLRDACSIAVIDRVVITSFYIILGFLFGAEIIKDEIKKKLKFRR